MDKISQETISDDLDVESLKQRISEIPLVHKPSGSNSDIEDPHMPPTCIQVLRQCKSCVTQLVKSCPDDGILDRPKTANPHPCKVAWLRRSDNFPSSITAKLIESGENSISSRTLPVPSDVWIIGNFGSRNAVLVFRSSALACASEEDIQLKPAYKLHITYKVLQAETKLLSKLLDCHGVMECSLTSNDFNLFWTGSHPKPGFFRSLNVNQRINHFPRSYELTRKDRLYKNIEAMQHTKGLRNFDFIPQSFIMPGDYKELCSTHYRTRGPWIVKPVASSRGRGIFIVQSPSQVPLDEPVVVAKYISNPLLIGGHKCDLRLYVAVTSYDPLLIYIYEEGLVRFATVKYDTSHKQLWNPCMHLCNYSINKYHSDYVKSEDPCAENVGHKWTLSALLRNLKSEGKNTVNLMAQIEDMVVKAILASAHTVVSAIQMFVPNQNNCFELFGFDILVDETLKPWLLEVNLSPSLGCDSPLDVRLKSAMLADLLTLVGLPAVDPILKPTQNSSPIKLTNSIKMKLGACRRVHSADGLSNTFPKRSMAVGAGGRLANSTLCLTAEEMRIVKAAKAQFERRGGWVRIFPTVDSWTKYSQYLDSASGIPVSALPSSTTSSHMTVNHNYNFLVYTQLFPDINQHPGPAMGVGPVAGKGRQDRYERQLNQGHRSTLDKDKDEKARVSTEDLKRQVVDMLRSGKALTQNEARRTFSQYLSCILKRISNHNQEQDAHVDIVLKFLQKASTYLKTPFVVKVPCPKLTGKDRAAIVAKQLHDFLYLYNRETDLYSDSTDRLNFVPNKLFVQFLDVARECDLEEVLTLQTIRSLPKGTNVNWGFQGLLKCFPNVTANCTKIVKKPVQHSKKIGIKVSTKPS